MYKRQKQFRQSGIKGEIGFVNVLQPHTPLTDSAEDRQASDMADAIPVSYTHLVVETIDKNEEFLQRVQSVECPVLLLINKIDTSNQAELEMCIRDRLSISDTEPKRKRV